VVLSGGKIGARPENALKIDKCIFGPGTLMTASRDIMGSERIKTYKEFWYFYLREHSNATSRKLHYIGTTLTFPFFIAAVLVSPVWFWGAPICGYFFAWLGHFKFQKNRPATFQYPMWSLISDYKMYFYWLTGKLGRQLKMADVPCD
jgi:hypothetical protein